MEDIFGLPEEETGADLLGEVFIDDELGKCLVWKTAVFDCSRFLKYKWDPGNRNYDLSSVPEVRGWVKNQGA